MAVHMTAKSFVGMEIRRAREAQKMSRAKLAKTVLVSESLVAAWETGRQAIRPEHIRELIGVLKFDAEMIERIVTELVNGEGVPEWEGRWLAAEKLATSLWSFETTLVNGLLQSPEYAQTVLSSDELIKERLERQQRVLAGDSKPTLVALMDESILRRKVGSAETMAAQLEFLADCAICDNVFIHIVPMDCGICSKFSTPFLIATLDDGRNVAYTDGAISGEVIERPEDIAALRKMFELFRADALRQNETVELIRKVAQQWME
ncbi:helix-turn-helix transcriptional regulator [Actinomadura meridiana]|uniref:Helix-turn-helix transcriptional regulator n=1 Tax=Actinomadura meridiana TaxID=559626 RepID=A0ABP8CH83_9ACTN